MKRSALVFLLVLLFTSPLFAQMPWEKNIRLVDIPIQNNTPCGEVIGNFAVGVDDLGVTVWSLENPDEPRPHFRLPLPGAHWAWFRNGDYFYIESTVDNAKYIDIVDISNPGRPEFRNRIQIMDNDGNGYSLVYGFLHGNHIYAGDPNQRLMRRFSLQDPVNPVMDQWEGEWAGVIIDKVGNFAISREFINMENFQYLIVMDDDQPEEVLDLDIVGGEYNIIDDILLCKTYESLIIYDLSNPQRIRQISELEGPFRPYTSANLPNKEMKRSMVRFGDYIALTAERDLYIMNLADPENPELLFEFENNLDFFLLPLFVNEGRLYVIAHYHPMTQPHYDEDIMMVFDISDPDNVEIINEVSKKQIYCSSYDSEYMNIRDDVLSMVNCRANYTSFRMNGIETIPLNTIQIEVDDEDEWISDPGIFSVYNENIVSLAIGNDGVFLYDFADPENPELLSNFEMEQSSPLFLNDSLLFISERIGDQRHEISMFNVTDLNNPELISQTNCGGLSGGWSDLQIVENYIFYNNKETNRFEAAIWEEDEPDVRFFAEYERRDCQKRDSLFYGSFTFFYPDLENEEFIELAHLRLPGDYREEQRYNERYKHSIGPDGLIAVLDQETLLLMDAKYIDCTRPVGIIQLPYKSHFGVQWVGNEIFAKNPVGVMRLRPAFNNDPIILTPDTLDFGRHTRFSVTNRSLTLSIEPDEGLSPILNYGFEGDTTAFFGEFAAGWVAAGYNIEMNVRFRPVELGRYEGRVWYETEHGIIQTVLLGVCTTLNDVDDDESLPEEFYVSEVYPNPFNSSATINYYIPSATNAVFSVYDLNGKEVYRETRNHQSFGNHRFTINLHDQPTGEYFIKINAGEYQALRKVVCVR